MLLTQRKYVRQLGIKIKDLQAAAKHQLEVNRPWGKLCFISDYK